MLQLRLIPIALFAVFVCGVQCTAANDDTVDFQREIRPILSANCFQCHGPDDKQREADLRLDVKASAFAEHDGWIAFVPGKPTESEALRRIASDDADERMPPTDSGKQLTERQIALVHKWIEQGARWNDHWAFVAPERPPLPAVKQPAWVRTPIDAFVLARLEREGLSPAPEAERVTLLRRLSLDLVGLPPTIAEVDAFLADESADAYGRQVERLLQSPHYGERWGRHWLDAARYADSDGYEKDKPRRVWFYRDWVIDALNRDLPYDRFVIEQIAGDLLPAATQDQIVATGFLRNSMNNEEGGIDPEQFRMEAMYDRMDAVGKSVLGLTIQCAQCHNHKYDPLTQEDYYRLFAFLNDAHEANVAVYSAEEQIARAELLRQISAVEAELQRQHPDWPQRMAAWEDSVRHNQPQWTVVRPSVEEASTGGQRYLPLDDGSLLAQGYAPTKHRVKLSFETDGSPIAAFRLELLNDANLPLGGPGRSHKGTAALTEFEVEAVPRAISGEAAPAGDVPTPSAKVKFIRATADVALPETPLEPIYNDKTDKHRVTGPVEMAIDGKVETAWGTDAGPALRNQPRKAVFTAETPTAHLKGTVLHIYLSQQHGGYNSNDNQSLNLGRFRISVTSDASATADPLPAEVRRTLSVPRAERSTTQTQALFSYWRTTVPDWQAANSEIEAIWKRHPEGNSQLALAARQQPRDTRMLERGDFLKPGKSVSPGAPDFLHAIPTDAPRTRLTFARWLVDRRSPTTARAMVNRIWQTYFGVGLVETSEDLGSQAETPSHPELLDWLAVELMDGGWSQKSLHRLIVLSSAYRQSSRAAPELYARDPANRLLARGARFRVEAEIVRDIALAASGLLNPRVGGPTVYPPAPEFLFLPPASYGEKVWPTAAADGHRRALYTFRYRSVPFPALQSFDAPNGDFSCVRRARSNTPLQALTTLNEPVFVDCARALAQRTLREGGKTDADRLRYAFRRCVARGPTEGEAAALGALLARQTERFAVGSLDPWTLAADDPARPPKLPEGVTPAQAAGWTAVARVLLNLDETISKE